MTTFDSREQAFENKFKHDEETLFRIRARRARLLGEWAADRMGLSGGEADGYAREVVEEAFGHKDAGTIVDRVHSDLEARGVDVSRHRVEREADALLQVARDQITSE